MYMLQASYCQGINERSFNYHIISCPINRSSIFYTDSKKAWQLQRPHTEQKAPSVVSRQYCNGLWSSPPPQLTKHILFFKV